MSDQSPRMGRKSVVLYDRQQLSAIVDEMARRVVSVLHPEQELVVVGVLRRGAPLADLLCARLLCLGWRNWHRIDLEVKRYSDDLTLLYPETHLTRPALAEPPELSGRSFLVVDDVLYHGHSLLRVLQYLVQQGAESVRSVILVDRCVSALPLRADVAGLRLEVAEGAVVEVHIPPYEEDFAIELVL